jgi:hypothetical protein
MFAPGQSGNARGLLSISSVYGALLAEHAGRELSAADKTLLEHAARLLVKATRTRAADPQVRATNAAMKIIERLRKATRAKRTPLPPLGDMVEATRAKERAHGHAKGSAGVLAR